MRPGSATGVSILTTKTEMRWGTILRKTIICCLWGRWRVAVNRGCHSPVTLRNLLPLAHRGTIAIVGVWFVKWTCVHIPCSVRQCATTMTSGRC